MNLKNIGMALKIFWKKHGNKVLVYGGIGSMAGGTVAACVSTYKHLPGIVEEHKTAINEEGASKTKVYLKTAGKIAKAYAIPTVLWGAGTAGVCVGFNKEHAWGIAMANTCAEISAGFAAYRKSVQDAIGEERENDIYNGTENMAVEKDGKEETVKKEVKKTNYGGYKYRYTIDGGFEMCQHSPDFDETFLLGRQKYWYETLKSRATKNKPGRLFLNEVLIDLHHEAEVRGQYVGWTYYRDGNNPNGDNFVDFRINRVFEDDGEGNYHEIITLDFNVDGDILTDSKKSGDELL